MTRRRPGTGKTLVAVASAFLMAAGGAPTLLAAAPDSHDRVAASLQATVKPQGSVPHAPVTPGMLESMRRSLLEQQKSPNRMLASRAARMLAMHDIVAATDRSERHAKIRALPVTIVRSQTSEGNVTQFVVGGKTRLRWVSPVGAVDARDHDLPVSGPSVEPQEQCYDGEPPCATEVEMEDLGMVLAATAAELDAASQQLAADLAAYEEYCRNNPWACESQTSGPSDITVANCWSKAALAGVAVVGGVTGVAQMQGQMQQAVATGWRLTRWGVGVMIGSAFVLGYAAGTAIDSAYVCFYYNQGPFDAPILIEPYESTSMLSLS